MTICESVDGMRCIVANSTPNLYHSGLREVGGVEHFEVVLAEEEIA